MVSLTEGQKATISLGAVEFLNNIRHPPLANTLSSFITSPCRVHGLRENFSEKTAPGEATPIERHKLQITVLDRLLELLLLLPPVIKPGKQKKILFNIFGGAFIMGSPKDRAALTMAAELGVRVYSVAYTKSPEAKYPEPRNQCLAVYRELLQCGPPGGSPIDPYDMYAMGCS
ncbi:hypothetical protein NW768_008187 [Fusarium equiseti]|uniref:Alpha/beta hydrolase fold-3 domain-containing protein n=1 Tax=Fusarium equiseti TaxID=61235 RepID=A0ABQ8R608_FUSEQ|nr:hypothetical protein NW768_008187 [Fusarium equiseti]